MHKGQYGFTLIELLITIGILAILGTASVLVINPAELLKQTRDATRVADLQTINKALSLYEADGNDAFGVADTVYLSLPDTQADCSSYASLPALPGGWSYACRPEAGYRHTDGTGWLPVDLGLISSGPPLATLPIDPVNTDADGAYYAYIGGSWVLSAQMESEKHRHMHAQTDSGGDDARLEVGSHLALWGRALGLVGYWGFDEGSGSTAHDGSGNGHTGVLYNEPTWVEGKIGRAIRFDGSNDWVALGGDFALNGAMTISLWFNTPNKSSNQYFLDNRDPGSWWFIKNYTGAPCSAFPGNICFEGRVMAPDTAWQTGEWTHLVVTDDTHISKMYINGEVVGTGAGEATSITTNLRIGTRYTNSGYFSGMMDEVRLYNRALSVEEVAALYRSGL